MEGVMMKSPTGIAMAVREPDGNIALEYRPFASRAKKGTFLGLPIVRGVVAFVEAISEGMGTLTRSAELAGESIEEEPSKFEKWLAEKLGKSLEKVIIALAVILAVVLSVGLFFLLYTVAPNTHAPETSSKASHNVVLLLSPVCGVFVSSLSESPGFAGI